VQDRQRARRGRLSDDGLARWNFSEGGGGSLDASPVPDRPTVREVSGVARRRPGLAD